MIDWLRYIACRMILARLKAEWAAERRRQREGGAEALRSEAWQALCRERAEAVEELHTDVLAAAAHGAIDYPWAQALLRDLGALRARIL